MQPEERVASEDWQECPRFPGYFVNSVGQVFSTRQKDRVLRQKIDRDGYCSVRLYHKGSISDVRVHRLVLEAFVGPPPTDDAVSRHLNGIRDDNRVENLAWGTVQDNHNDMWRHGTWQVGELNPRAKLNQEKADAIRWRYASGERVRALAAEYGVVHQSIYNVLGGITWA